MPASNDASAGYRLKRINEAEGDVARFSALLSEYIKAPVVTRRRIYIETLQDVMPGIRSKIIVDEQTRGILPLLNCESAPNLDPHLQHRKPLSGREFLVNGWGHDWTPIKSC
jgi:hypothetical protein